MVRFSLKQLLLIPIFVGLSVTCFQLCQLASPKTVWFGFIPLFVFLGVFFAGATVGVPFRRPVTAGIYFVLAAFGIATGALVFSLIR
jgi:hypothetical protein